MLYVSIILYLCGFGLSGYLVRSKRSLLALSASLFLFSLLTTLFLVADEFTGQGINEAVIYHTLYGFKGAGINEYRSIALAGFGLLGLTIAGSIACFCFHRKLFSYPTNRFRYGLGTTLLVLAFSTHPAVENFWELARSRYQTSESTQIPFQNEYAKEQVKVTENPQNLVFVYAESLEQTYFDETLFPGLVPDLKNLQKTYQFTNIEPIWATGFTIAGMLGSQCGIPLVLGYNDMAAATDTFYEGARCLGDILKPHDYHLTFIQGTSIVFSGIQTIYKAHRFDEVFGRDLLQPKLESPEYVTHWGLFDDSLLAIAYEKFIETAKEHPQHATFVATMDTHHPNGHLSASCENDLYGDGQNPILNAVHCSQKLIANFVTKIVNSEYGDNTVVVVISDHLAMKNTAADTLKKGRRRNLFWVIDPRSKETHRISRRGSIFDTAATALDVIGFTGALGLGRSLLDPQTQTLLEKYKYPDQQLKFWRSDIAKLWHMPSIQKDDDLWIHDGHLTVKNTNYKFPLVAYTKLDGTLSPHFGKNIPKKIKKVYRKRPFLWIDRCKKITRFFKLKKRKAKYCYSTTPKTVHILDSEFSLKGQVLLARPISPLTENKKIASSVEMAATNALNRDRYIAHAGGKFQGHTYTNSLEAMNNSYQKGFRRFELDISKTSEGIFVAAHDWKSWSNKTGFRLKNKRYKPSLKEFHSHPRRNKTTSMDMRAINKWFQSHPDATLVTDKVNAPKLFAEQFQYKKRLIMELFSKEAVLEALQEGIVPMPSWLHVIQKLKGDKLQFFLDNKITHMSMPIGEIAGNEDLLKTFKKNGVKIFLYHINYNEAEDETFVTCRLMNLAYGLYADSWNFPKQLQCQ